MFCHIKSIRLTDHKETKIQDFPDSAFLWDFLQRYWEPDMLLSNSETSLQTGAVEMFQKQNSLNNIKNCSLVAEISLLNLTHWRLCRPWRALAFLPLLTSSLLTKISIIYTRLLQEEKIFPMMPRWEWSAQWSLRYAQKCSKTRSKISCHYTWMLHAKNYPSRWRLVRSFLMASKPSSSITAAKTREKEKKERRKKKIPKIEKPKDVGHFLIQKLSQNLISAHARVTVH